MERKGYERRFKDVATVQLQEASSRYRPCFKEEKETWDEEYRTSLSSPGRTFDEKVRRTGGRSLLQGLPGVKTFEEEN